MNRWSLVLAAGLCLALSACGKRASAPSLGRPTPPPGRKLHLAFVTSDGASSWAAARAGANKAAAGLPNVALDFQITADGTAATQKRIVDDLLARGMDGIAISPVEPGGQTPMLVEASRQTLLFTLDRDAAEGSRACYLGADNAAAGRQLGEIMVEALPGGGQAAVFVGEPETRSARERLLGLRAALTGHHVEIVEVRPDKSDPARTRANALDVMSRLPNVVCLAGLESHQGPALVGAVKEANRVGGVELVCFDETDETLQGIRDGTVFGTVVQQPYEYGLLAIDLMSRTLVGDNDAIPPNRTVFVPTKPVKRDTVEAFAASLQEVRKP